MKKGTHAVMSFLDAEELRRILIQGSRALEAKVDAINALNQLNAVGSTTLGTVLVGADREPGYHSDYGSDYDYSPRELVRT